MSNPAEHEARKDAERRGQVVGSDVDRIEAAALAAALADAAGDEDGDGAWLWGEREPV